MHSNLLEAAILNITNINLSSVICDLGTTYFGHERLFLFIYLVGRRELYLCLS